MKDALYPYPMNSKTKVACTCPGILGTLLVLFSVTIISCSFLQESDRQTTSEINWDNLQGTPQPNGALCLDISARKRPGWEEAKREADHGLFTGVYPVDPSQTREIGDSTFLVDANSPQTINLRLWYPKGNDRPSLNLRMFLLLDDEQLANTIGEGPYYDVELETESDTTIPLKIPPLTPGVHDVIVVAIPYPQEYPNEYGIVIVVGWRMTFIVPPNSYPFRKINFISLPAEGSLRKGDPWLTLELNLRKDQLLVWNWPSPWLDVRAGDSVEFDALAGHRYVDNLDAPPLEELNASFFSLLLFMDYQQIEIAPGQLAFYGSVDKDTAYARVPVKIDSLPEGKHELLALRIDFPGVPMCVLKGDPKGRILPNDVNGKLVGIKILPPK